MTRLLRIRPEAEADLHEARTWYEAQASGLGDDFLQEIHAALSRIEERPQLYPVVRREVRRALVRRFPYGVYHVSSGPEEVVLAVIHLARDPARLRDRLSPRQP